MKVCFETFGCRLSRAEALEQEAEFAARGWERTDGHADADLIVVRGCSVTQRAQRDCERLIEHIRLKYPMKRLVVTGCLPQKTKDFFLKSRGASAAPAVPTRTSRAYLKVQDGCSGKCTFCIVPTFRGESVSTGFAEVLAKARRFVDAGYSEIVVTGCNLALYASEGKRLPDLVAREVLDVMAERKNVCRFLHLPVQSGSSRILSAMGRRYSARDIDSFVRLAREKVPGIALGCDLMTGFPGESDIDFLATKGLLTRTKFERVHVFPFSERPGTQAATIPFVVPDAIRRERAHELAWQADKIRSDAAREFIGKTVEFVVEDEKTCSGWTSEYFWCSCPHSHAERKSLAKAKVRSSDGHMLSGEIEQHGR